MSIWNQFRPLILNFSEDYKKSSNVFRLNENELISFIKVFVLY